LTAVITQRFGRSSFDLPAQDGLRVACARWTSRCPLRGVVQIAHGMGEHIGRYVGTIEVLVSAGLTVYANDHRGHGRTAPSPTHFGDFGESGFEPLVEDMTRLSRIAKEETPDQPFMLLGHSMGSFAAQQYVLDHNGRSTDSSSPDQALSTDSRVWRVQRQQGRISWPPLRAGADAVRLVEPR
jgi:alpha-beta hydrolase superfamily lysophospholipase